MLFCRSAQLAAITATPAGAYQLHGAESPLHLFFLEAGQDISHLLWTPKVHNSGHKNPDPLPPPPSDMNPVHIPTPSFSKIHFDIIFLSMVKISFLVFRLNFCVCYRTCQFHRSQAPRVLNLGE